MKKKIYIVSAYIATLPMFAFAATRDLNGLIELVIGYLNKALALLMGLAVVIFIWYIIKYFITPNDKRTEAAQYLLWSVIGFFVIFSMWGLVNILIGTFDLGSNNPASWGDIRNLFPSR